MSATVPPSTSPLPDPPGGRPLLADYDPDPVRTILARLGQTAQRIGMLQIQLADDPGATVRDGQVLSLLVEMHGEMVAIAKHLLEVGRAQL